MTFYKGHKAGRPKGSLNVKTKSVIEILSRMKNTSGEVGFDAVSELVKLFHRYVQSEKEGHLALKCLEVLMPYCHSKIFSDGITARDIQLLAQLKALEEKPEKEIIEIAKQEFKRIE